MQPIYDIPNVMKPEEWIARLQTQNDCILQALRILAAQSPARAAVADLINLSADSTTGARDFDDIVDRLKGIQQA